MDPNPLLVLVLKLLSPILPEPLQYFGIEVILAMILLVFFALRLFRLLCGPPPIPILAGTAFVLLSPPLTFRVVGHYAPTNHWLIVAGLLVFFLPQKDPACSIKRFFVYTVALASISVATTPYIAFQVLLVLTAGVVTLYWQGRLRPFLGALGGMAAMGVASIFTVPGGWPDNPGRPRLWGRRLRRFYSMNLLAPIDPGSYGSVVLPRLPVATGGQYEGYNYLGAGFLLIVVVLLPLLLIRRKWLQVGREVAVPLIGICVILTMMALSTKISAGSLVVLDLDPHETVTKFLAPFRASGRLFWAPYYTIVVSVLVGAFALMNRRMATILVLAGPWRCRPPLTLRPYADGCIRPSTRSLRSRCILKSGRRWARDSRI